MFETKKECLEQFRKLPKDFHDHLNFMDNFGWYAKKHYFREKCCENGWNMYEFFEDSDFYDLMKIFEDHREFILFCLLLSDGFSKKEGKVSLEYSCDPNYVPFKAFEA